MRVLPQITRIHPFAAFASSVKHPITNSVHSSTRQMHFILPDSYSLSLSNGALTPGPWAEALPGQGVSSSESLI